MRNDGTLDEHFHSHFVNTDEKNKTHSRLGEFLPIISCLDAQLGVIQWPIQIHVEPPIFRIQFMAHRALSME